MAENSPWRPSPRSPWLFIVYLLCLAFKVEGWFVKVKGEKPKNGGLHMGPPVSGHIGLPFVP